MKHIDTMFQVTYLVTMSRGITQYCEIKTLAALTSRLRLLGANTLASNTTVMDEIYRSD